MSRGFQSEYLLYVKRRNEELKVVETRQGKHAGVKPLNVSCTLAKVVREHGRLVIQRPGLDVSRSPRRKGRKGEEGANVSSEGKKKLSFPAAFEERPVVAKKRASIGPGLEESKVKSRASRCDTWSCDPGFEPEPSTSYSGDHTARDCDKKADDQDRDYEDSDQESTTSFSTTDSEERIEKTLEERVQATHVESKRRDVSLPKNAANVNMPSTKSSEKNTVVSESLLASRPKRVIVPKSPEDATGLSWTEETQLKKALYASLQESRLQRQTSKQSDVTDGDCAPEASRDNLREELLFEAPSSFKLDDMVVVKRGRKRKMESETSSVSSMATSSVTSPTKEQPKGVKEDAFDLKKAQVRAQRKFAQGSRPNSPNITPVKLKSGVAPLPAVTPCKRARTEDFLTFLCLRGTPALPPSLDFFNYPPEYNDDVASTASTPKNSRMSLLKREIRSKSPQSSGSSTADRRDISDKTGDIGVKPIKLGSPPKPLKKRRKQIDVPPSLFRAVPVTSKRPRKVITPPPLEPMAQMKPRRQKVGIKLQDEEEERRPRRRAFTQPLRRAGPKTRAFFLAKNARQTARQRARGVKKEEDVYVDIETVDEVTVKQELEEVDVRVAKRQRAQTVIKRSINKLRRNAKRNQSRSLRSSTMVQRSSSTECEPKVRETRSRVSLSPSAPPVPPVPLTPEAKMKRPAGRPKTIKPEAAVKPRVTRQSTSDVKSPESSISRRTRPTRKVGSYADDFFDFEDPMEIETTQRRRSEIIPKKSPAKVARPRRQSYASSVGTRSLSSESRRSTSRESSPEKRSRPGFRCSPRIKAKPGSEDAERSSRPVTRRSRASYSELSLDVSGFSDDPESHPKSPSVRSTTSVRSTSSVSSLRYSIKSGELSPVGSVRRGEVTQLGKQPSASSNNVDVAAASKTTLPAKQTAASAKQITPVKQAATPPAKQGGPPGGRQVSTPTERRSVTPTRKAVTPVGKGATPVAKQPTISGSTSAGKQGATPTGKQGTLPAGKQSTPTGKSVPAPGKQGEIVTRQQTATPGVKTVSPTRRSGATHDTTTSRKSTGTLDPNPPGKQAATAKPAVGTTRKLVQENITSGKSPSADSGKPTIATRKMIATQDGASGATVGKPATALAQRAGVTQGHTPPVKQASPQAGKPVVTPTRKLAASQDVATSAKQITVQTGKLSVSPTRKVVSQDTSQKQSVIQIEKASAAPTRKLASPDHVPRLASPNTATNQKPGISAAGKPAVTPTRKVPTDGSGSPGRSVGGAVGKVAAGTGKLTSPTGRPADNRGGKLPTTPLGPVSPTRRLTPPSAEKRCDISGPGSVVKDVTDGKQVVPVMRASPTAAATASPVSKPISPPGRQMTNASRTLTPSKPAPSPSKVTTSPAQRNAVAVSGSTPVTLSPKTPPKSSTVSIPSKGAVSIVPRAGQVVGAQRVSGGSVSPKVATSTNLTQSPAQRTIPINVPKGSPITIPPKPTTLVAQKVPYPGAVANKIKTLTSAHISPIPPTSKGSVHVVKRSTNIGARIAANPKLNYRTISTGTSSMTRAVPLPRPAGTIVKPSAAGIKIPASPEKTSGVNMLLKFASSSARPSATYSTSLSDSRSVSTAAARPAVSITNTSTAQTSCVPSTSNTSQHKAVVPTREVKEHGKHVTEAVNVNKSPKDSSSHVIPGKETVASAKPTNTSLVNSPSADGSTTTSPAKGKPVSASVTPATAVSKATAAASTGPTQSTVLKQGVSTEKPTQQSSPKAKAAVPVRASLEIVKATSPSESQDVQLSQVSSTSESSSNTSRPVTPVGGQTSAALIQMAKNGGPPKRKRKGPKTIRDLLEARQASIIPGDQGNGDGKKVQSVIVGPKIPAIRLGAPPSMVNVMVQGNSVQSMGLPGNTPQVEPVQMVSEGVQTCDEDCEEGSDLPVLISRKRKFDDEGQTQGQPSEKKVKEKVRKTKDKMKKIKDIEPSITYVTESGQPTKEPDHEKARKAAMQDSPTENRDTSGGESPVTDAVSRPATPVAEVAPPLPQRGGKRKAPAARKRGRHMTIGKALRTSPPTVEDILEAAKSESASVKVKFPPTDGTACMIDTPLYMPTEQEFQDPMAYIAKIRPEAEKYGMCRIQPPASWKPDCKVHDEMRFTSQIQYIHLTHHRWGPNREKMECIKKHLQTQNVEVEQLPLIGGIELDLPRLGATIQEFGGLQHVLDKKKWNKVADVMGISKLALDRTTKLYDAYCKYLLSYDTLSKEDKEMIRTQVLLEKNSKELEKEKACVIKGRSNSLCGFYRAARNTMAMWFKDDPTSEQAESEYWRVVGSGRHHVAVQCGQVDTRITGSGFPNRKENPYSRHPWNLNILANNGGSVLRYLGPIGGVTIPTLYVRMLFTSSCWSRDLHLMPYIAYMHSGSDLVWYSVPKSQHSKFREVMTEMFPERVDDQPVWLKKDMIMVPPKQLVTKGISVTRTVQKQRQFVVVFPEVFTANVSCGYNISEQVNLAHPDYLPLGHHAAKILNESRVPEMFPYEKMLCSLAKNEKAPMEVLCLLVPLLEKVVEEELHYRHQLQSAGLKRSERMCVIDEPIHASWKKRRTMDTSDEDDNVCEISKKICYISMVVNEAEDVVYSLPHAMPHIQKKKSLKSCKLMYRYTEDELKQMVHNARERLTNPPEVAGKKRKSKQPPSESEAAPEPSTSQ